MAALLHRCPNTGALVVTGQHVTPSEFEATLIMGGRFRCSACQRVHDWAKKDVRLAEHPGATSRL